MRRAAPLVVVLLGWLLLAPAVAGARTVVSPGNSAGNEYLETLPGAGGSQALLPGASPHLPASISRTLSSQGTAGLLVLGLGPGAPASLENGHRSAGGRGHGSPGSAPPLGLRSTSPASVAARAESTGSAFANLLVGHGPGGMGLALPVILGAILLAALLAALRRATSRDPRP